MKPPHDQQLPPGTVGDLTPLYVLDEDVVPRLFTAQSGLGQLMLGYLADEAPDAEWYLLSPTSRRTIAKLESGDLPLRDALTGAWLWLVRRGHDGVVTGWTITEDDVPPAHLPVAGVRLRLEHCAVLSTRAIGQHLGARSTPASVVSWVADATRKSVKVLVDHLLSLSTGGRPTDLARSMYDLPIHHLAFNSFEIGFGAPSTVEAQASVHEAVALLQAGFDWIATEGDRLLLPEQSADQRLAVLEALRHLAPPNHGAITSVEVGGQWLPRAGHLSSHSRRRLQREIDAVRAERAVSHIGQVRELDLDRGTFIIRDVVAKTEVKGTISAKPYEPYFAFFTSGQRATVSGVRRGNRFYATGIGPVVREEGWVGP